MSPGRHKFLGNSTTLSRRSRVLQKSADPASFPFYLCPHSGQAVSSPPPDRGNLGGIVIRNECKSTSIAPYRLTPSSLSALAISSGTFSNSLIYLRTPFSKTVLKPFLSANSFRSSSSPKIRNISDLYLEYVYRDNMFDKIGEILKPR